MFPVPDHLPRSTLESTTSIASKPDPTLDLLSPFFDNPEAGPSSWTAQQAINTRRKLQEAIHANKVKNHELLTKHFANISSQIRTGSHIRAEEEVLTTSLERLQKQINPNDPSTSFLPPVLNQINRHYAAKNRKAKASAHLNALREVKKRSEEYEKLKDIIVEGRGAEPGVVGMIVNGPGFDQGAGGLAETNIMKDLKDHKVQIRTALLNQLKETLWKAISMTSKGETRELQIRQKIFLVSCKLPDITPKPPSHSPPAFPLQQIFTALHRLDQLKGEFDKLSDILQNQILTPLISRQYTLSSHTKEDAQHFILHKSSNLNSPEDTLKSISLFLDNLSTQILPSSDSSWSSDRDNVINALNTFTHQSILSNVLLPPTPHNVTSIPDWLALISKASNLEDRHRGTESIIREFKENNVGKEWAENKRRRVFEDVKKLVLEESWGNWEGREITRDKEITVFLEVEVEDDGVTPGERTAVDEVSYSSNNGEKVEEGVEGDEDSGWEFEEPKTPMNGQIPAKNPKVENNEVEVDEWGFNETPSKSTAKLNATARPAETPLDEGEGWDFEIPTETPKPAPPPKPTKKVREAKKLGKKIGRTKLQESVETDDDLDKDSEIENQTRTSSVSADSVNSGAAQDTVEEGWGWDDPNPVAPPTSENDIKKDQHVKKKRKELKEEKRIVKERYQISKACDDLLNVVKQCLNESKEVQRESTLPPSFASSSFILKSASIESFEIFTALILSAFSNQLNSVPALAMQLSNDFQYLSTQIPTLFTDGVTNTSPTTDVQDLERRSKTTGEYVFENQLSIQRDNLLSSLDRLNGLERTGEEFVFKEYERELKGIMDDVEALSRVLKTILPLTTFYTVMGYLVDTVIQKITEDILALQDITEIESEKLNELLRLLQPLDQIFTSDQDGTSSSIAIHVPHWLKFNYISELLTASLVDILYLLDQGALIDFTREELVNLIKALFADSEKRDNAIEKVEGSTLVLSSQV